MTEDQLNNLFSQVSEMNRLDALTVPQLVQEVIGSGAINIPAVAAMMRRLYPAWSDDYDDNGEPKPGRGLKPWAKDGGVEGHASYRDHWSGPVPHFEMKENGNA